MRGAMILFLYAMLLTGCVTRPAPPSGPVAWECTGYVLGEKSLSKEDWERLDAQDKKYHRCFYDVYVDGVLLSQSPLPQHPDIAMAKRNAAEKKQMMEKLAAMKAARSASRFRCKTTRECKKAFALTQIFINTVATRKIQLATDTIIETYGIGSGAGVAIQAVKKPLSGDQEEIAIRVFCNGGDRRESCYDTTLAIYKRFPEYIAKNLQ